MEITKKAIQYLGIDGTPSTLQEVRVEISGLRHAIKVAEEMVCRLEQAVAIMDMKKEEMLNGRLQAKGAGQEAGPGQAEKDAGAGEGASEKSQG